VASALLRAAGTPIAAPSANRASQLSPTTAAHVVRSLGEEVDLVLDAGPTPGGIESTVLDLTVSPPCVLRPGLVGPHELETVIGPFELQLAQTQTADLVARSPGQQLRHYAPRAPLECCELDGIQRAQALCQQGLRVGWLTLSVVDVPKVPGLTVVRMPRHAEDYASRLYAELHALDEAGVDRVLVDLPPPEPQWLAVRDRLSRASCNGPERA
jgi:L-threonylcarbamoyladenylate synthase